MKAADPLTLPLQGVSLIEASAGTGKTTALVNTYLRAVLTTDLKVDQILVVTYTRAATGELISRIRKALVKTRAALSADTLEDDFLTQLVAQASGDKVPMIARVEAALAALDESAVFTIHSFCQRMLADLAFEVGGAFVTEQRSEEQSLRDEIAADFWRQRQAMADPAYARWFLNTFKTPGGLLGKTRDALAVSGELHIEPHLTAADLRQAKAAFAAAAEQATTTWQAAHKQLTDFLQERPDVNRKTYNDTAVEQLIKQWETWLATSAEPTLPDKFELLTIDKLSEKMNQGKAPPPEPFFEAAQILWESAQKLRAAWWQETCTAAIEYLRSEARKRKRHAREIGFEDMLQNLCDALVGTGGKALAERMAERFPLALVDEFQDTDPRQYEIFSRIYRGRKKTGLILIGDPKQAIYRFRGADVFTYMQARRACEQANRVYRLARNFRTTEPLVMALNTLFGRSDKAFIYEHIPFAAVESGRPISPLNVKGEADAPLTLVWKPAPNDAKNGVANKNTALLEMAEVCAEEIERLLVLGEAKQASYTDTQGEQTCVRARDIAVLVSTHKQGDQVQRELRWRGIAAVTLSTDSVFSTAEAADFQTVLTAVTEPARGPYLRRALATPLLGATANEIAALGEDEMRWSRLVAEFRDYNTRWQRQGFAAMFAQLLRDQGVIERTLARADGERAMTNLRHLGELAEAQAAHHPGIESLMAWLARECAETHRGDESRELRLESDAELVRIATIHKAKGLEYPIVFLPFLWDTKQVKVERTNPAVLAHDETLEPVLDLGSAVLEQRQESAAKEHCAEQARLAYVALTRAAHACYVLCTPARQSEHSALARLLGVDHPDAFEAALGTWCADAPDGAMHLRAPERAQRALNAADSRMQGTAREFIHPDRLQQRFHIASYSLLATGASGAMAERPDWDERVPPVRVSAAASGIHAFPAGAASGTLLHAVLEALDFDADAHTIETTTRRLCAAYGFNDRWVETLSPWLAGVLTTPLELPACTLAAIARPQRSDELEFYFPLARIEAQTLDAAVAAFAPQVPHPALAFAEVAGQMKGYMDLVFEHDGRYWIADYKSNRLGSDLAAYTPAALDRAMAEHRYDLQYLVYTVALHRYLQTRIADYDYERHFGGVLYLFLRGMAPDTPAPHGIWHTRPAWSEVRRLDALFAGEARV